MGLSKKEHEKRHKKLHRQIDDIAASFTMHTGRLLSEASIMDLMKWAYSETVKQTPHR